MMARVREIGAVLVAISATALCPRAVRSEPTVSIQAGYTTFALGDVKDLYQETLDFYRESNIAIPTQREFPGNLILTVEALWPLGPRVRGGFAVHGTRTRAFSSYGDETGTVDVNGSVKALLGGWVLTRGLGDQDGFRTHAGLETGLVWSRVEIEQEVVVTDFPELGVSERDTWDAIGFQGQLFFGVERSFGGTDVLARIGGRFALPVEQNLEVNLSGVTMSLGAAWSL
jgi:hypothetical protein